MKIKQRIEVRQDDITKVKVEAIVNAANERMLGGGGVDGAIHRAAGPKLLQACNNVPEVRSGVRCPTGEARITPGFKLPARYIIHTVGPVWNGGRYRESELLANCYRNCLKLAVENNIKIIAFPAISTGVYRYPLEEATKIAVSEIQNFLHDNPSIEKVIFVCFGEEVYQAYLRRLENEHLNIRVKGKVQGVWYRDSTRREALKHGITGFVRNEQDGSVYIEAEGEPDMLEVLVRWCRRGPENARVTDVEITDGEMKNYRSFNIKPNILHS